MTPEEIFESFNNAWRGLCRLYDNCRTENLRNDLNLLSKIIRKVEDEYERSKIEPKEDQISIEEWIRCFQNWKETI